MGAGHAVVCQQDTSGESGFTTDCRPTCIEEVETHVEIALPAALSDFLRRGQARLVSKEPVLPCELGSCHAFHGNDVDRLCGFCCAEHLVAWEEANVQKVKSVGGDIEEYLAKLDTEFAMQRCYVAGPDLPDFSVLHPLIHEATKRQTREYLDCLDRLPGHDQVALSRLRSQPEAWPEHSGSEQLKEHCVQSEAPVSLHEIYARGFREFDRLYGFTCALGRCVHAAPDRVAWSVKSVLRLSKKSLQDYPVEFVERDFRHCSDVFRTSLVLDSVSGIEIVLRLLTGLGRPTVARYRVTWIDGLVMRMSMDMSSKQVGLLPHDATFEVLERVVNEHGVARLQTPSGWVSEARPDGFRLVSKEAPQGHERRWQSLAHLGLIDDGAKYTVERIKNRFARPCIGGYQDLLVNVRINGYVSEIQVHLKCAAELKKDEGRRFFKWAKAYSDNISRYQGEQTSSCQPHGQGAMCWADGGRFVGQFQDGHSHGRGVAFYPSGDKYEGEWTDGEMHGSGSMAFADGDRFVGEFRRDQRHGKGLLLYADGDAYDGEWHEGQRHGQGSYLYADGRCEASVYAADEPSGPGVHWSADRERAWRLWDGHDVKEIGPANAVEIAAMLGFPSSAPTMAQPKAKLSERRPEMQRRPILKDLVARERSEKTSEGRGVGGVGLEDKIAHCCDRADVSREQTETTYKKDPGADTATLPTVMPLVCHAKAGGNANHGGGGFQAQPGGEEFAITLDKSQGMRLGADVDHEDGVTLLIETINGGLMEAWNRDNPGSRCKQGDRIVEVNDLRSDVLQLVEECKKNQVLRMKIRPGADP